jgi:hypothetical protein
VEGEGIDGRISPWTGSSERIVLTHCTDTQPGCSWWGNAFLLLVLKNLALGGLEGFYANIDHILVWGESRSLFPCDGKRT